MGQRLNIEIVKNNTDDLPLANAYYHWSGFTRNALNLASVIMEVLEGIPDYCKEDDNLVPLAVSLLEDTNARLDEDSYDKFTELYPNKTTYEKGSANRNDGLIAITEKEMEDTRKWEEARVVINVIDNTVDISGAFWEDSEEDEDYDKTRNKKYVVCKCDLTNLDTEGLENIIVFLRGLVNNDEYRFKSKDNRVLSIIE